MTERVVFGEPWFGDEEQQLVAETIASRWIGQGPLVERFERELASYLEASAVVAVSSCTAALHLSLLVAGVGPGHEVITTPMTFVATINAIEYTGATPVLVDVDPVSLLLRPEDVDAAITVRTRAVVPVSFGGRPLDIDGYLQIIRGRGIWVIEDAAHSIGAVACGQRVGSDRDDHYITCFSFYPNKNVASAEGGAIAIADTDLAGRLRMMRLHGLDIDAWDRYQGDDYAPSLALVAGYKYNWTDLQAAIAIPQLERIEGFLAIRRYLASQYDELLREVPQVAAVARGEHGLRTVHALHLYQVRVPGSRRDRVVARMRSEGVGAAVHYVGVNLHPRFRHLEAQSLPNSDSASKELISLPLHPGISVDDACRVIDSLKRSVTLEPASVS